MQPLFRSGVDENFKYVGHLSKTPPVRRVLFGGKREKLRTVGQQRPWLLILLRGISFADQCPMSGL